MTNQTDFGIVKSDIINIFNASNSPDGFIIENAETGTGGVGGNKSWTVSTASWKINQWAGWYLLIGSTYYLISSNTATALTLSTGDLTGTTGAYSISTQYYAMTAARFDTILTESVAEIISALPERYRKMIYKITGEIIVDKADESQTTATTTYAITSGFYIWKNLMTNWIERRKADGIKLTTDYTIGEDDKTITFVQPLSADETVICEYYHALTTVPKILKRLGILKTLLKIYELNYINSEEVQAWAEAWRTELQDTISGLNSGNIGITEFDDIDLIDETKSDSRIGMAAVEVLYG